MSDPKTSWNVFFKGPEGFKEHIQITADDPTTLSSGRSAVLDVLKQIGAEPEADRPRGGYSAKPSTDGMAKAAAQAGVAKACPIHGIPLDYKPGGVSKTKTDAQGNPKPYSASYRCPDRNCKHIEWL